MMYLDKFICAVKANGKILREFKDVVYVPYGIEYQILLKNLNTVRALVNITIDGDNMSSDGLVLLAGQEIVLERSIKNGNLLEGNKFKFVERTGAIEKHRGIKLEDGIVQIKFQFEQPRPAWHTNLVQPAFTNTNWTNDTAISSVMRGSTITASSATFSATAAVNNMSNDIGITVPGSKSSQRFTIAAPFTAEKEEHVLILNLRGETADNRVSAPVTVKHKPKCVTCGKINKATSKYCVECGTHLEIFA